MKSILIILFYISVLMGISIGSIPAESKNLENATMKPFNMTIVETNVTTNVIPSVITNIQTNSLNIFLGANMSEVIDLIMHQNMTNLTKNN